MRSLLKKAFFFLLILSLVFTGPLAHFSAFAADETEKYPVDGSIFDDVASDSWYCPYVTFVLNKGIMVGVGNNLFAPNNHITRAEFATIIYRISGSPEIEFTKKFKDVENNTWYSDAVTWASQENVGIIYGYTNGEFRPFKTITREEMASILYRYAVFSGFIDTEEEVNDEIESSVSDTQSVTSENAELESIEAETTDSEIIESQTAEESEIPEAEDIEPDVTVPEITSDEITDSEIPESEEPVTANLEPLAIEDTENDKTNVLDSFADSNKIALFALEPMQWVVENGIIVGESSTRLNPQGNSSRAVAAAVLQRIYYKFMNGQLENIDLSASCDAISANIISEYNGTFKITVTNPKAATGITKVQAIVYSKANRSDQYIYTLSQQSNGTYQTTASTSNHHNNPGTYTIEIAVYLKNGIRIIVGSTTVKLINLWNLVLVNPWNKLPSNFNVELVKVSNGHYVDKRITADLQAMLKAARSAGVSPAICSSYRTQKKQETLFNNKVNYYLSLGYSYSSAVAAAGKWVAVPGTSEHQLGLALDIVDNSYWVLDRNQENTAAQKWLMKNSYKYGFILRYDEKKSNLTGINYEPWHYRYVGKDVAKEIYEKGICFEEYINSLK